MVDFALIVNYLGYWGPFDQFSIKLSPIKGLLKLVQITLRELVHKKNFKNLDKCQIGGREVKSNPNFLRIKNLDMILKGR